MFLFPIATSSSSPLRTHIPKESEQQDDELYCNISSRIASSSSKRLPPSTRPSPYKMAAMPQQQQRPSHNPSMHIPETAMDYDDESSPPPLYSYPQDHTLRRQKNTAAWDTLLPTLVHPLMAALKTMSERPSKPAPWHDVDEPLKCHLPCIRVTNVVNVLSFGGMHLSLFIVIKHNNFSKGITQIEINHCNCVSPAVALLQRGCFPSTPIKAPKWAFDIGLLEFSALHFQYGTPNVSAWCNATSAFLSWCRVANVPNSVRPSNTIPQQLMSLFST